MNKSLIQTTLFAALATATIFAASTGSVAAQSSLREWYFGESILMPKDTKQTEAVSGCEGPAQEWVSLFNFNSQPAKAEVTLFFEDAPPKTLHFDLAPNSTKVLSWHNKDYEADVPRRKLFSTRVRTDRPIIAQSSRAENPGLPNDPGNSDTSRLGYAGLLGKKETKWALADSLVNTNNPKSWRDLEFLTILNPNPGQTAEVSITWYGRNGRTTHKATIAPERVIHIDLSELPESERAKKVATAGVIVESNIPIIPESIRRTIYGESRSPRGMWSFPLYAIGDQKL